MADARVREELYLAFQARIRGVMDERFKLLEYRTGKPEADAAV